MTDIDDASRRAARALGERLARVGQEEPSRASFTDTGTIEQVMSDGTALVSYRGGTIGPLPMTTDCVGAAKGRTCVIAIDGPVVRVIGLVARTSSDLAVPSHSQPASTVTGTLAVANGGTGATTSAGARSSLGLSMAPTDIVAGTFRNTSGSARYLIIGHSKYEASNGSQDGFIRAVGHIGGMSGTDKCAFDVTVSFRTNVRVYVSRLNVMDPSVSGISLCQASDGTLWLYAWTSAEWHEAYISAATKGGTIDGTWSSSLPAGTLIWTGDSAGGSAMSPGVWSGMSIGTGLKASGTTLSVDNGAYVKLLWSGMTQSAVTLSASCASFRAIVVAICGSDGVTEASTLVWSPNGKTFDVAAAFVVGTSDWRSMRMRFTASGTSLKPTYNLGQIAGGSSANAYLQYVVGIV